MHRDDLLMVFPFLEVFISRLTSSCSYEISKVFITGNTGLRLVCVSFFGRHCMGVRVCVYLFGVLQKFGM